MIANIRNTMRNNRNIRALGVFVIFYICFTALMLWQHERLLYQPPAASSLTCPALTDAQVVHMNGTHFYYKHHPERIMVIYHGNAGNACDRAYLAEWLTQADWGYLLVAYSGYSDDTGRPTHNRIRTDVKNITTYLQTTEVQTIAVLGESLGAAVAGIHATLLPPDALLLITPFDSLARIARHHYWYLPTFLVTNGVYDTMAALENYNGRVMIIHGTNDMVIPISHAQNLYEIIPTKEKYFISVAGASHNDLWSFPVARAALEQFLQE